MFEAFSDISIQSGEIVFCVGGGSVLYAGPVCKSHYE